MQGLGFRVWGLGLRFEGLGLSLFSKATPLAPLPAQPTLQGLACKLFSATAPPCALQSLFAASSKLDLIVGHRGI